MAEVVAVLARVQLPEGRVWRAQARRRGHAALLVCQTIGHTLDQAVRPGCAAVGKIAVPDPLRPKGWVDDVARAVGMYRCQLRAHRGEQVAAALVQVLVAEVGYLGDASAACDLAREPDVHVLGPQQRIAAQAVLRQHVVDAAEFCEGQHVFSLATAGMPSCSGKLARARTVVEGKPGVPNSRT